MLEGADTPEQPRRDADEQLGGAARVPFGALVEEGKVDSNSKARADFSEFFRRERPTQAIVSYRVYYGGV